ncbi:MAG TPA: hypothetical protein VGE52_14315, partial [Pirellulales bacterium]
MTSLAPGDRIRRCRRCGVLVGRIALAALTWLGLLAGQATAQMFMPVAGTWTGDGYVLNMTDSGSTAVGGRRPISLRFNRFTGAGSDTELYVELEVASRFNRVTTAESFTLPARAMTLDAVLRVPCLGPAAGFGFRIYEDGVLLQNLRAPVPDVFSYSLRSYGQATPRFLFFTGPFRQTVSTSWLNLAASTNTFSPNPYGNPNAASGGPSEMQFASLRGLSEAPTQWADYSTYDFVGITREQLQRLTKENPAAVTALRQWVGTGGNLIVGGCGDDWSGLGDVETLFGFEQAVPASRREVAPWRIAKPSAAGVAIEEFRDAENEWWAANAATDEGAGEISSAERDARLDLWLSPGRVANATKETKLAVLKQFPSLRSTNMNPAQPAVPRFATQPFQFGMVIAVATPNLLLPGEWDDPASVPLTPDEWRWMFADVGPGRCLWENRNGVSFSSENSGHAGFRIPGVGRAPVLQFQILITLFALVIGPLNFYLLRRNHRLHLMLITVPLCAGIASVGLLGYALFADGFGTKTRVRSITLLDQPLRQATTWSRQAYYSGLTPSNGLTFSQDVVVMPVQDARDSEDVYRPSLFRRLVWADGKQELASGWLAARKPTQFLTARARSSEAALQVGAPANEKLPVKNELGAKVKHLFVREADDKWYSAADVEPGASLALDPIDSSTVRDALAKIVNQQVWEYTDESSAGAGILFRPRYYYNQRKPVLAVEGVMEARLQGL